MKLPVLKSIFIGIITMALGKLRKADLDKYYKKPQDKQHQLSDGGNLYVLVTPIGSCKFKYRIHIGSKSSWIAIGDYPVISLDQARQEALRLKSMVHQGIDPIKENKKNQNLPVTLAEFMQMYIKERLPITRKIGSSTNKFIKDMNLYVISVIGNYSLPEVTNDEIAQIIQKKTVAGKYGTARSIRSMLKVVLDYAVEKKFITTNPVASIKYYNIRPKTDRDRYLNEQEIGQFLGLVYSTDNIHVKYKIAIHLLLMLLLRKTELIHAKWEQVDFKKQTFTYAKWEQVDFKKQTFTLYTSKTTAQLVILLPTQAIRLLEILKLWSIEANCLSDYIFSGFIDHNVPIHENSLNKHVGVINKKMFGDNKEKYFTIHDLRRTGTTHLSEMEYDSDYIEVALNHKKTGIKKVYHRSKHINTRKKMLQVWADEIDRLVGKELLPYDNAVGA